MLPSKSFFSFLLKFLAFFMVCYFGSLVIIGLAAPGGYYSYLVDHYLDYISWIRSLLLSQSSHLLSCFGIDTYLADEYHIRQINGRGVIIGYDCVGYGIMSFWAAFVFASKGSGLRKLIWIFSGLLIVFILNLLRICLLLIAVNKGWPMPFGLDHHTLFNIIAYLIIFVLIFLYEYNLNDGAFQKNR